MAIGQFEGKKTTTRKRMSDEPIVELVDEKVFLDCPTVEDQTKKDAKCFHLLNFAAELSVDNCQT